MPKKKEELAVEVEAPEVEAELPVEEVEAEIRELMVCGQKVVGTVLNGKLTTKEGVTYDC